MLTDHINDRVEATSRLYGFESDIIEIGRQLVRCIKEGNKIITCGNGGSEANHMTTELMGRFLDSRPSLPSVCLNANCDVLTCLGNDYGYDHVFSRQLQGIAKEGDIFLCFTTSGNSPNVIEAIKKCPEGVLSVAILGKDGGKAAGLSDLEIILPSFSTAIIQELSLGLIHYWCGMIDKAVIKEN